MKYSIRNEKVVFDHHFKMIRAEVSYDTFLGDIINTDRLAFEHGDSAAIVLLEKETQTILLAKQFRYPTCKHEKGWILEIPAGSISGNETPEACIIKEIEEELGYEITDPEPIHTFYTSPGASTERMFLFYKAVSVNDKTHKGGGNPNEKEDIQLVKIPVNDIFEKLSEIIDAKTIIGLQWFLLKNKS